MAKESLGVLLSMLLFSVVILMGIIYTGGIVLKILFVISILMICFTVFFFRDPKRQIPAGKNLILSPADGKIISIKEVNETEFLKTDAVNISIFMSVFDVHINRIPMDGNVSYFDYKRGKFHQAFREVASYENEQTMIGIENEHVKILFKQVAGIVARRIVCHLREGTAVKKGERFGMIKFGSRVDIFVPKNLRINIRLNERVKAGGTILGSYDTK